MKGGNILIKWGEALNLHYTNSIILTSIFNALSNRFIFTFSRNGNNCNSDSSMLFE